MSDNKTHCNNSKEQIDTATEQDVCHICLEEFTNENETYVVNCKYVDKRDDCIKVQHHKFHNNCIIEWSKRSDICHCPVCRNVMFPNPNILLPNTSIRYDRNTIYVIMLFNDIDGKKIPIKFADISYDEQYWVRHMLGDTLFYAIGENDEHISIPDDCFSERTVDIPNQIVRLIPTKICSEYEDSDCEYEDSDSECEDYKNDIKAFHAAIKPFLGKEIKFSPRKTIEELNYTMNKLTQFENEIESIKKLKKPTGMKTAQGLRNYWEECFNEINKKIEEDNKNIPKYSFALTIIQEGF